MKYICQRCGKVVDEDELETRADRVSDYAGGSYEYYSCCPCGGDVSDAKRCELCDEYFEEDDVNNGVCDQCMKDGMTLENALKFGATEKETVEINQFIAYCFTQKEIEELLRKELKAKHQQDENGKKEVEQYVKDYAHEDLYWFADMLKGDE